MKRTAPFRVPSLLLSAALLAHASSAMAFEHAPDDGALPTSFDRKTALLPAHAELDVTPDGTGFGLRTGRVAAVAFEPIDHVVVLIGGVGARHDPIGRVSARSLDVGSFAFRRDVVRLDPGNTFVFAGARGTFSMWDRTWSDVPGVGKPDDEFHVCASQSDLEVELGLRATAMSVALFFADQGDPFHFGNGEDCLGGGAIWESSRTVGLTLARALPRDLELVGTLEAETSRLSHEEHAKGDAFGVVRADGLRGFLGLRLKAP